MLDRTRAVRPTLLRRIIPEDRWLIQTRGCFQVSISATSISHVPGRFPIRVYRVGHPETAAETTGCVQMKAGLPMRLIRTGTLHQVQQHATVGFFLVVLPLAVCR